MKRTAPRGTTLVEIMVGILILATGLVMVISAVTSSMRVQSLGANRLIALNIAREGMEAMRNIRDTNWLVNSGNKRACWNYGRGQFGIGNGKPYIEISSNADPNAQFNATNKIEAAKCLLYPAGHSDADINKNPIKAGYYTIVQDLDHTFAWQLENFKELSSGANELGSAGVDIRTYSRLTEGFTEESDQLKVDSEDEDFLNYLLFQIIPEARTNGEEYPYIYTHASQAMQSGGGYILRATNPKFFRQVRIRYLCDEPTYDTNLGTMTELTPILNINNYPVNSNSGCNSTIRTNLDPVNSEVARNDNRMEVTVIVQWFEAGRVHEVRLMTHLTDWLERRGHDA